ncbi:Tubulin-folding cofactor A-like protein [Drosera capensis]
MATVRNLKIKTNTCKRIVKELQSYEKEVEREAAKTVGMKEKGADPYDLKQQAELEESNENPSPEFDDARSTIAYVENLLQTQDA